MKDISGVLAVASLACPVLAPVVGVSAGALALGTSAIATGVQAIGTGHLGWESVAGLAVGALGVPEVMGASALSTSQLGFAEAALHAGTDLVNNGRLTGADLAGLGIAALNVPAGRNLAGLADACENTVRAIQGGLNATPNVIDHRRLTIADLAGIGAPLLANNLTTSPAINATVENGIRLAAQGVQAGRVSATEVVNALMPLLTGVKDAYGRPVDDPFRNVLGHLTDDRVAQASIYQAVAAIAERYDTGEVSLKAIARIIKPFAVDYGRRLEERLQPAYLKYVNA
jgi:hypothetical protein